MRQVLKKTISFCIILGLAFPMPAIGRGSLNKTQYINVKNKDYFVIQSDIDGDGRFDSFGFSDGKFSSYKQDINGDGYPDLWRISRGRYQLELRSPINGYYTDLKIKRRGRKKLFKYRFFVSEDGKRYRLFTAYKRPFKKHYAGVDMPTCDRQDEAEALRRQILAMSENEVFKIFNKTRFIDESCNFDQTKPGGHPGAPDEVVYSGEARRYEISRALADLFLTDPRNDSDYGRDSFGCLNMQAGAMGLSSIMQLKMYDRIFTGENNPIQTFITCSEAEPRPYFNERSQRMNFGPLPKSMINSSLEARIAWYRQKIFHELLHSSGVEDESIALALERCCGPPRAPDSPECTQVGKMMGTQQLGPELKAERSLPNAAGTFQELVGLVGEEQAHRIFEDNWGAQRKFFGEIDRMAGRIPGCADGFDNSTCQENLLSTYEKFSPRLVSSACGSYGGDTKAACESAGNALIQDIITQGAQCTASKRATSSAYLFEFILPRAHADSPGLDPNCPSQLLETSSADIFTGADGEEEIVGGQGDDDLREGTESVPTQFMDANPGEATSQAPGELAQQPYGSVPIPQDRGSIDRSLLRDTSRGTSVIGEVARDVAIRIGTNPLSGVPPAQALDGPIGQHYANNSSRTYAPDQTETTSYEPPRAPIPSPVSGSGLNDFASGLDSQRSGGSLDMSAPGMSYLASGGNGYEPLGFPGMYINNPMYSEAPTAPIMPGMNYDPSQSGPTGMQAPPGVNNSFASVGQAGGSGMPDMPTFNGGAPTGQPGGGMQTGSGVGLGDDTSRRGAPTTNPNFGYGNPLQSGAGSSGDNPAPRIDGGAGGNNPPTIGGSPSTGGAPGSGATPRSGSGSSSGQDLAGGAGPSQGSSSPEAGGRRSAGVNTPPGSSAEAKAGNRAPANIGEGSQGAPGQQASAGGGSRRGGGGSSPGAGPSGGSGSGAGGSAGSAGDALSNAGESSDPAAPIAAAMAGMSADDDQNATNGKLAPKRPKAGEKDPAIDHGGLHPNGPLLKHPKIPEVGKNRKDQLIRMFNNFRVAYRCLKDHSCRVMLRDAGVTVRYQKGKVIIPKKYKIAMLYYALDRSQKQFYRIGSNQ